MRIKVRLGRDTVIAFEEVKNILYKTEGNRTMKGFIIGEAWKKIKRESENIDWVKVGCEKIPGVSNNNSNVVGVQTTLNIDEEILDSLKEFQYSLSNKNKQIYYFPYIIKLVLFAFILDYNDKLPLL